MAFDCLRLVGILWLDLMFKALLFGPDGDSLLSMRSKLLLKKVLSSAGGAPPVFREVGVMFLWKVSVLGSLPAGSLVWPAWGGVSLSA